FRVEPGETEAALLTHPAVTQAVVTVHHEQLAAYVVTDGDTPLDEIRRHVAGRLPEHLVPTHLVPLDRLPLTPNGKVDKRALPEPAPVASAGRAPRTPLEETIRDVFQHPTPARLAEHIESLKAAPARKARPALRRRATTEAVTTGTAAQTTTATERIS
ncbi:hypothetical protein, partial [Streptomyces globisporus]|uniref:AMP-binding enzyme n=1 Tax=Streptomyces globisporus TaxID=1908 RepID=UPI000566E65C